VRQHPVVFRHRMRVDLQGHRDLRMPESLARQRAPARPPAATALRTCAGTVKFDQLHTGRCDELAKPRLEIFGFLREHEAEVAITRPVFLVAFVVTLLTPG
jgi:hypothetical protein